MFSHVLFAAISSGDVSSSSSSLVKMDLYVFMIYISIMQWC